MADTPTKPVGLGLVGCGAFGRFCLDSYADLPQVRVVAVADAVAEASEKLAGERNLRAHHPPQALFGDPEVELVHLATPPRTHPELAHAALEAGQHVLCEKPLATTREQGEAMMQAAERQQRILANNLVMRYNPLCEAVRQIAEQKLLGEPLHGFFENYAKDEPLPPGHWFWDREQSGGIFIEHGVHFFDLFSMWLGKGEVLAAQQARRPYGEGVVEQVHATCGFGSDRQVLVNFYHGFHQAERMDRQEMRLVFERGDLRLFEWVPTDAVIDAILPQADAEAIAAILPHAKLEKQTAYSGAERDVTSRHRSYQVDGRYRITAGVGMDKEHLYRHVIRELVADQAAAVRDPAHLRRVSESHGLAALRMAADAQELADLVDLTELAGPPDRP